MKSNNRYYAQAAASLVFAVAFLIGSAVVAYKNHQANEFLVEKHSVLENTAETKSRTVLAKPLELKTGDKYPLDKIVKHLESIGYTKTETFDSQKTTTYSVEGTNLKLSSRFPSAYPSLTVTFSGEKISMIQNPANGEFLQNCKIEGETLGTFVIDNTNGEKVRASREFVSYEEIKDSHLVRAIISSEDRYFFSHHGINYKGLSKAFYHRLTSANNSNTPGGSTISQQLVKNLLLTSERTVERKQQEAFLAVALEHKLSKEQILEHYLNTIYWGHIKTEDYNRGIYGASAASSYYFGKEINALSIAQAATLASLIDAPGKYENNPNHPKLIERRERTLRLMLENFPDKYSDETIKRAKSETVKFSFTIKNETDLIAEPFVNFAMKQLKNEKGVRDSENAKASYILETNIEAKLLKSTNQILANHLRKFAKTISASTGKHDLAFNGSVVAVDRLTGQILLMDGLRLENGEISSDNSAFDLDGRFIASSIKPFILAYALQKGSISMDTVINPSECGIAPNGWEPIDSSASPDTIRNLFVPSKNKAMVCVLNQTGYDGFLKFMSKIAQKDCTKDTDYRIANGINNECAKFSTLQLASAYTMFPDGMIRRPTPFSRIFRNGEEIQINQTKPEKIVDAKDLAELTKAMRAIVDFEVGKFSGATAGNLRKDAGLPISADIIGKSGSSELDFWMTTAHPRMVLSVHLSVIPKEDETNLSTQGVISSETTVPLATDLIRSIYSNSETRYLLEGKFNQAKK